MVSTDSALYPGRAAGSGPAARTPAASGGQPTGHRLVTGRLRVLRRPGGAESRTLRDWLVDTLVFVLCCGFAAPLWLAQLVADRTTASSPFAIADLVAGLACLGMLWWRRRLPVQFAVLTAVASSVSVIAALPALVGLYTVAERRTLRTLSLMVGLNVVACLAFKQLRPDEVTGTLVNLVVGALAIGATVAWGLFARARYQLILSLRDRAERAEAERTLLLEQARLSERTRIAREMHDVLGHRISLIALHAGALEFRADKAGGEVAESAAVIRASAHEALQDLREVIGVLRTGGPADSPRRPQPTLADLPDLVEQSRRAGMRIAYSCSQAVAGRPATADAQAPELIGRTAYRIVQEGLTNARKHAPGTAVTVTVAGGPGIGLDVVVSNRRPLRAGGPLPAAGAPGARAHAAAAPDAGSVPTRFPETRPDEPRSDEPRLDETRLDQTRAAEPRPTETRPVEGGSGGTGQGLVGLAERVGLAEGRLDHGCTADGDFRLSAWLPWQRPGTGTAG